MTGDERSVPAVASPDAPASSTGSRHSAGRSSAIGQPQSGTAFTRYWWLIALMTILAAAASIGATVAMSSPKTDASVLVRVGRPQVFADQFTDPAYIDRVLRSVATISGDPSVQEQGLAAAGVAPDTGVLEVSVVRETELLEYRATDTNPTRASAIVVAYVDASEEAVRAVYGDTLEFDRVSSAPESVEVTPPILLRGLLGATAGLLLGVGVAVGLDRNRRNP